MPEKSVVDEVNLLNPKARVSDLTVEQFFELISFHERSKEVDAIKAQYERGVRELQSVQDQSAQIFNNAKDLTVTTPFELKTLEEVNQFMTTVVEAVKSGNTLVIAMAVKNRHGG